MSAFNPFLPSWEYIPDGEPHVFGDRVYLYGSHDRFGSYRYCLNDYVCYSAPLSDLSAWKYEGVIYERLADPIHKNPNVGCLYAPDATRGPDGRYYLFYCLSGYSVISVAVCDTPAGKYEFYGHVRYPDGSLLGTKEGDEFLFDPAVITEGDKSYLYYGFSSPASTDRSGAMGCVLDRDMLTVLTRPVNVIPSKRLSEGTGFEDHAFFEASSIRKVSDTYYFVYSSEKHCELCYATSKDPLGGFVYGGVLVSNNDIGIDSYKRADMPTCYGGNNHGGMACLNGQWYIFYHRHTNGTCFARQACAEPIFIKEDGSIDQAELTSCGLNKGPLPAKGRYPAYIACNLFTNKEKAYTGGVFAPELWLSSEYPKITQDGYDGDENEGYILNMLDSATAGFKYFDFKGAKKIRTCTYGFPGGKIEVRTSIGGEIVGECNIIRSNFWDENEFDIDIPDGVHSLYFTYRGPGQMHFKYFEII